MKVNLEKRHWRLEIWLDHRATEEEAERFMDAVADVVCADRWGNVAPGMIGVLKEINEP